MSNCKKSSILHNLSDRYNSVFFTLLPLKTYSKAECHVAIHNISFQQKQEAPLCENKMKYPNIVNSERSSMIRNIKSKKNSTIRDSKPPFIKYVIID